MIMAIITHIYCPIICHFKNSAFILQNNKNKLLSESSTVLRYPLFNLFTKNTKVASLKSNERSVYSMYTSLTFPLQGHTSGTRGRAEAAPGDALSG